MYAALTAEIPVESHQSVAQVVATCVVRRTIFYVSSVTTCTLGAHLHPMIAKRLRRRCDVAPNGLKSHSQATDKFDPSVDADAWCNSTGQNP